MVDAAVDRNVSEQVRYIIFDAIKSIRKKSKRPDTISIIEYITRNLTNFKEVELRNSISKLVDSGILINKKTKQDLDSLFINEGTSTDNTPQGQNNTLPDINPVDIETPNCILVETYTKSDRDRFNNLKGEVNRNTANFAAFKSFVLDELHEIKEKVYNFGIQNPVGRGLVENLKEEIKFLREKITSKSLIIKILIENINNHENLKSNNSLYNDFTYGNNKTKSKNYNNNLSNTPETDFNIRNNFVEGKDACSNKANFMNSNIPTYNRFDKLRTVENTQNDTKIDDVIEVDVSKARQIPFVKSSKSTVNKRPGVVINKYPENQHIFGKVNINAKRAHETYTDAAHGNIKKDTRKIIMFTDSIPRAIWKRKFNQCTDGVARLKSFPGAISKELEHYVVPTLKEESFHTALIHVGINDILRDQSELQQQLVLQNIVRTAHQCKEYGVKEIILFSVVATGRVNADVLIHFNESLKNLCRANGFSFAITIIFQKVIYTKIRYIYLKLVNVSYLTILLTV